MLHISAWSVEGEGVGLICVRITETVAAKKKTSPMVPHGQKGEYNTGNFIK